MHCRARFTQACHLQRHTQSCAQGKAVIDCPAERVEAPQTAFEKAFYPKHCASQESLRWLQREPSGGEFTFTTQHAGTVASDGLCGFLSTVTTMKRGRYFNTTAVTGTDAENVSRVIVIKSLPTMTKRAKTGYIATLKCTRALPAAGYHVIEAWACEVGEIDEERKPQTRSYPHAILYDFEGYGAKNQRKKRTRRYTVESVHMPISVSVVFTLE